MKRARDELAWDELPHLQNPTKNAKGDTSDAPSPAPGKLSEGEEEENKYRKRFKQGEPSQVGSSHSRGSQSKRMECAARQDEEENSSLLNHEDPRVRLRALTCLHAHIDLLSCDAAGIDRLSQALHSRLSSEGNPHVAQQIVRLMCSLLISTCKHNGQHGSQECDNVEYGSNAILPLSTVIKHTCSEHQHGHIAVSPCSHRNCSYHSNVKEDITFCHHCKQSAFTNPPCIDKDAFGPTQEPSLHMVNKLLLNGLAETGSLTLKLQTLRSFYQLVKEVGAVSLLSLQTYLPKLLASSNAFIRAHTLHLLAMIIVTSKYTDYLPHKEDMLDLFEEYTHDCNAFVRKAALQSFALLYINGYLLTYGCYQAALSLLQDLNSSVRTLALQVVSLWVEQDPEEHSNHAFLQVCKMMTDMELCVRIEACKAFLTMNKIREDLLLQALSKQPLELSAKMEESQSSSVITISESDVDISQYEQGLNLLDQLNMGALVHGIEDEFYEVRALALNALAHFCCSSARALTAIIEVMINLVNDDSKHVRVKAIHALIHVAHQYGLEVNDNDLQTVQGTLEDIDGAIQDAGKTLLADVQFSSVDSFKSTIESLMNYMQRSQQEEGVKHALYRLGKAHSLYVQVLAKDLLKELKGSLSWEAGLDAPECGCILLLFAAASESNTRIFSLVPSHILSLARLLRPSISQVHVMLKSNSTGVRAEMLKSHEERHLNIDVASSTNSENRRKVDEFLACTVKSLWKVKDLLISGMISTSKQVLSGCRGDLKEILNGLDDENQVALATYVFHYVDCIDFVSQGWTYFQQKARKAAARRLLPDLAHRLEFVVKCMQHTFMGHTSEQKLDLLELSTIPALWRMTIMNDHGKFESAVQTVKNTIGVGSFHTPFLQEIKEKLFETGAISNSIDVRNIASKLASTFWPRPLTINYVQKLKATLSIPGNSLEHPLNFVPNLPFGITVHIFTKNLHKSRVWVRMQLGSVWTDFTFLDAEDYRRVDPFITILQIHGVPIVSQCILKVAVLLECPGMAFECVNRGPNSFILPLTSDKIIHLVPSSNTHY